MSDEDRSAHPDPVLITHRSSLRVAVDVTPATTQGAGIGRVARHLARALPLLDRETQYTYLYATEGRDGTIPAGFLPVPDAPAEEMRLPARAPGYGPAGNVTLA